MTDAERHRIPPHVIDEIRARTPMASIIGRRVKLERAGSNLLRGCCPFHCERTPSFYVYPDHYHCFACGVHGDVFRFIMDSEQVSFLDAVERLASHASVDTSKPVSAVPTPAVPASGARAEDLEKIERMRAYAHAIWLKAEAAAAPLADYLAGRGIDLAELGRQPRALRYHPGLWHPHARVTLPAMVAAVNGGDGKHICTHCTWLERVGGAGWIKARLNEPRLTFGSWKGGHISLWRGASGKPFKDALADEPMVVVEGIETGLSIALAAPELRIVSAVNKGNLGGIWLPPQVRFVILAADNDESKAENEKKRLAAIRTLQRAIDCHLAAGRHVRIARSPIGKDFNDALQDAA